MKSRQITGNVGLFFVCYQLSKRGWNVLPTSRNAKGVDIVIYNQNASKTLTIQVKSLSKRNPVGVSKYLDFIADLLIICRKVYDEPEIFIAKTPELKNRINEQINKKGKKSYWIETKDYESFLDNWEKIGLGDN